MDTPPVRKCAACERRRLRRQVKALEAELVKVRTECDRLSAFEPRKYRTLRFSASGLPVPRSVVIRVPDQPGLVHIVHPSSVELEF